MLSGELRPAGPPPPPLGMIRICDVTLQAIGEVEPTVSITVDPVEIPADGVLTVSWNSTNATTLVASGAWSGSLAASGRREILVDEFEGADSGAGRLTQAPFAITVRGPGGVATASGLVRVGSGVVRPPPVGIVPIPPPPAPPEFCDGNISASDVTNGLRFDPFAPVEGDYDPTVAADAVRGAITNWLERPRSDAEPPQRGAGFLADVRAGLLAGLDPESTFVARARSRLRLAPRLEEWHQTQRTGDPLDDLMSAPEFPQPMYEPLQDLSKDHILPGVETIPQNTVSLLATNRRFIESYMCGLNHEFSGELLWREYPTDHRGTYFRQFWDVREYVLQPSQRVPLLAKWLARHWMRPVEEWTQEARRWLIRANPQAAGKATEHRGLRTRLLSGDASPIDGIMDDTVLTELARAVAIQEQLDEDLRDITPVKDWGSRPLGTNKPGASDDNVPEPLVLVIRGQLLQRYPNAIIYSVDALTPPDGQRAPGLPEYLRSELFSIPEETKVALDGGDVDAVRTTFIGEGRPALGASANVSVEIPGAHWLIMDGSDRYEVLDVGSELRVFESVAPVMPVLPVFKATLPGDLTFFGFPFEAKDASGENGGEGKYFVLEERVGEPRFGLDLPTTTGEPDTWNDLSWSHFDLGGEEAIGAYLDSATAPYPKPTVADQGISWEGDSMTAAERAWITLQRPVRVCVHASEMLPPGPDPLDDR